MKQYFFSALTALLFYSTLVDASGPEDKSDCIDFEWNSWAGVTEKGAMIFRLPIGHTLYPFQLDTGSYKSILSVDAQSTLKQIQNSKTTLYKGIDLNSLSNARIISNPKNKQSTLGLEQLLGKFIVIDYPGKKFCIFDRKPIANFDTLILKHRNTAWTDLTLTQGKLVLEATINQGESYKMIFDTGSSFFPLIFPESILSKIEGSETRKSQVLSANSWGKKLNLNNKMIKEKLFIGPKEFEDVLAYGLLGARGKLNNLYDGIIGNALFWDGAIILDLTENTKSFGIVTF